MPNFQYYMKQIIYQVLVNCLGVVLLSQTIVANTNGQDIITDRPDQTESSATLAKNYFQIETGTFLETDRGTKNWVINTSLFRYGITDNFELRLVSELSKLTHNKSETHYVDIGNMEVGAKIRLVHKKIELAYLGHVIIPSSTKSYANEKTTFSNKICLSHAITDNIDIGYNLGYVYSDRTNNALNYSCSTGVGLTKRAGFFTEIYGEWERFDKITLYYDNGFTYLVRPNLQLDFSFGTGINQKYDLYSAGVSWRLPN